MIPQEKEPQWIKDQRQIRQSKETDQWLGRGKHFVADSRPARTKTQTENVLIATISLAITLVLLSAIYGIWNLTHHKQDVDPEPEVPLDRDGAVIVSSTVEHL